MKIRHLFLLAALMMMPLVACNANGVSTDAAEKSTPAAAAPQKPDLSFLKAMGLDVSNLPIINDVWESSIDCIDLNKDQVLKLLPMAQFLNGGEVQIYDGRYSIYAAKALPDGYTLLLYGWQTGDDASLEMMAIYDKDGNITDFMQLGNMGEISDNEQNDDYTQGRAQFTDVDMKFTAPAVFTLDKTVKEADWKFDRNDDNASREVTKVHWLVQTLETYSIDNKGHMTLDERKEVWHQGTIDKKYKSWVAIHDLSRLPISDATRIDQLNDLAGKMKQSLGDQKYADDTGYIVTEAVAEFFGSNADALFQWIYKNRDYSNMIVNHLRKSIAYSYLSKSDLDKAIEQMKDKAAQQYFRQLTADWEPE